MQILLPFKTCCLEAAMEALLLWAGRPSPGVRGSREHRIGVVAEEQVTQEQGDSGGGGGRQS